MVNKTINGFNQTIDNLNQNIINLNQESLDGRNSVRTAIINKDGTISIPINPSFSQLVTGVGQIKSNGIDFNFSMPAPYSPKSFNFLGYFSNKPPAGNASKENAKHYVYSDKVDKIYAIMSSYGSIYNILTETITSNSSLNNDICASTMINNGDICVIDGTKTVKRFSSSTLTWTNIYTIPNTPYDMSKRTVLLFCNRFRLQNILLSYKISSSSSQNRIINISTGSATQLLDNSIPGSNKGVNICLPYNITTTAFWGSDGTNDNKCYLYNESQNTYSSFVMQNFETGLSGADMGGNRGIFDKGGGIGYIDLYAQTVNEIPLFLNNYVLSYDWKRDVLYSGKPGTNKIEMIPNITNLIKNTSSDNNYVLDLTPLINMGFTIYVTFSSNVYLVDSDGSFKKSIKNNRMQVTKVLNLGLPYNYAITGRIEIVV